MPYTSSVRSKFQECETMTYFIQANRTGWTLYRAAGVTQHVRSLAAIKMLVEDCGGNLVVLDRQGFPMEASR
jgi:hypothetical protein